jgi:ATP/maltotriose-dependent transcriptional regulator MalT
MLAFSHHLCGNQAIAEGHCRSALHLDATSSEWPAAGSQRSHGYFSPSHLAVLARTQWLRGQADSALATARRVVEGVAALKHPFERSSALILCEAVFVWCGEWAEAERLLEMQLELLERYSLGTQGSPAMALRGELLVKIGRPEEGCVLLRAAAATLEAEQNRSFASVYAIAFAEGLAATGRLEEALDAVERAIVDAERRGGTFDLPELLRVKGALLGAMPTVDGRAVEEPLSAAVDLARRQGALAWELRATTSLTRERLKRGASGDALSELSAIYGKFTEGMEAPDLCTARNLLERRVDRQTAGPRGSERHA